MDSTPALPTGAVTLLLTDIEGSTRIWEASEEVATIAVARHHALLDAAVSLHGGVRPLEQGEGDSVVAAFARPSDALAAALDAQRAFADEPWPEGAAVRVRIGLHTGEISLRDVRNYQGPTIIRAARLRNVAHGGQTLLSDSTHDLVLDRLPDGASLRDLGMHRLKDLGRVEHVWQLCHPELDDEFPPLRSLDALPNNLPVQLTTLVGRERELAEVRDALDQCRLVTLTGTGGCGKTRLALQVAAERTEQHAGGVWWVSLAPVFEDAQIVPAVASALSVHEAHDQPLLNTIAGELRGRQALMLIDNCEHLLDATAGVVEALLSNIPDLRVLATSREPLGVPGELAWRVPSLDESAAVALFVDRAANVRPGFAPDAEEREVVAQICRRLDGIPLAVELAAARVRMMHPRRIATGLDDRFRLLTGGSRTVMARQQTLEASIAWSHDLLDDEERAVLRRLAVFAGGFTVEAAEAVVSDELVDEYAVLDLLTRLLDKSLVQGDERAADVRYRLLETIRLFARERLLEAGETDATRARHLAYFLAAAEASDAELVRADGPVLLNRFETEHDNYNAALEWAETVADPDNMLRLATALTLFWELRGHLGEGNRWFARTLARSGDPSVVRARALWGAAHVAVYNDDAETARRLASEARDMAAPFGDEWTEARALNTLGYAATLWDGDDARPMLERSIALGSALADDWVVADGRKMLTITYLLGGDLDGLDEVIGELRDVATRLGNKFFLAWCDAATGAGDIQRGRFDSARRNLEASIDLCREVGDPATGGLATAWLGELEARAGDPTAALSRIEAFVAHANATGGHLGVGHAVLTRCEIKLGGGEPSNALFAGVLASGFDFPLYVTWAGAIHGAARLALGEHDVARVALDDALGVARRIDNPWAIANVLHQQAVLARHAGELGDAEDLLHTALALRQGSGLLPGIAQSLEALGSVGVELGSFAEAARLLAAATTLRDRAGVVRWATEQSAYDADLERVRTALGADEFDATWREGAALEADDAVAYASRARGERKRPSAGWASLTPTEERIVALAAEGLTNPQIAERMFIARGTVKVHLSHIFAKLGVSTRAELAGVATRRSVERAR